MSDGEGATRRPRPIELLEILALCGVAVVEPVLTAFRDGADVFVLRGAEPIDVVVFTVIVVLVPALALWGIVQIGAALAPQRRTVLRFSVLGLLVALVVIRALYRVGDPTRIVVLGVALLAGTGAALALQRWQPITTWLRVLAVYPVLLGLGFVATEPVSTLVFDAGRGGVGVAEVGQADSVVVLVLDELPTASILDEDDEIEADQFPNLARFAADATWYRNHSSVSPSTPQAVPALLTGQLPESTDALPVTEDHPDNLFTLLSGSHRMHVAETATRLCPDDTCGRQRDERSPVDALLSDARALWADQLAADEEEREGDFAVRQSDPAAPDTFAAFLAGVQPTAGDERPVLDFHHSLYPHQPWFHLPSGATYEAPFVAEGLDGGAQYSWTTDEAASSGQQRHLLQARHADALLGRLLDRLEATGRYDDSLVVVVADHGVSFREGEPIRGLSTENAPEVMWTPLLVKAPGQAEPVVDDRPMQTIDLLPTIADHLEIDLPFAVDGRSALDGTPRGTDDERVFFEWSLNRAPADEDGFTRVDGSQAYDGLLALDPPGEGDDPDLRFHRFGRHAELVGTPVAEVRQGPARDGSAILDQQGQLAEVDLGTSPLPVYLSGDLAGDEPVDVAVALNGTIAGWGRTEAADADGRQHFWTVAPEDLLVSGRNEAELFVIDTDGGDLSLRPVPLP